MDDEQIQVMRIFAGMEGISPTINCGNMGMGCIDHIDKCWVILGENQRVNLWDFTDLLNKYLAFWLLWLLRGFLSNNIWGCSGICDYNGDLYYLLCHGHELDYGRVERINEI